MLPYAALQTISKKEATRKKKNEIVTPCFPGSSILFVISADAKGRSEKFTEASIRFEN